LGRFGWCSFDDASSTRVEERPREFVSSKEPNGRDAAQVPFSKSSDSARGSFEAFIYLAGILAYHATLRTKPALAVEPPTGQRFLGELIMGVVAYDFAFYWLHRAFHHKSAPAWFRRLHFEHHRADKSLGGTGLRARETTHHTFLDGFAQVAVNVLVQQSAPRGGAEPRRAPRAVAGSPSWPAARSTRSAASRTTSS